MTDEPPPQPAGPLCRRCGAERATRGLKYCRCCTRSLIYRMRADGYLERLPRRPPDYQSRADRDAAVERRYGVGWWRGLDEDDSRLRVGRCRNQKAVHGATRLKARTPDRPRLTGRMRVVLELLMHDDLRVCEIAAATGAGLPSTSAYLARLRLLGAVERGPKWRGLRYRITPKGREMFMSCGPRADEKIRM